MSFVSNCSSQEKKLIASLSTGYSEYLVKEFGQRYIKELDITASIGVRNGFTKISIRKLSQDDEELNPISSIAEILAITELFRLEDLELELDSELPRTELTDLIVKHVLEHDSQYALTLSGLKDREIAQICNILDSQNPRGLRLQSCEVSRKPLLDLADAISNSKTCPLTLRNISIKDGYAIKTALFFKFGGSKELIALARSISLWNGSKFVQFDDGTMRVLTLFHLAAESPRVDTTKNEL